MPSLLLASCILMATLTVPAVPAGAADILFLSATASLSHHIWDKTLLVALRDAGHHVTMLTHAEEPRADNVTFIKLEGVQERGKDLEPNEMASHSSLQEIKDTFEWLYTTCELDLETGGFRSLLDRVRAGLRFDLVLMDIGSGQCMYPLLEALGSPPVVATSPLGILPHHTFAFGTNVHSSFIPFYAFPYSDQMTFLERANNYFHVMFFLFWHQYMYMPSQARLAHSFFGDDITPLDQVEKKFALLLANYDPVLNYPHPLPPAIVPVGGLHIQRKDHFPQDLRDYLRNSKHGAIVFSLGTTIRSEKLSYKQIRSLLTAFSRLKENVIWKYESNLENLPSNVITRKWLPQNEILAEPNVKLLITHAGALSTQEAMHHGVPVVGIPFFGDQITNIGRIIATNSGKLLSLQNFTTENLVRTIREVIDDPSYKGNASIVSGRYRDQMNRPLERAVFWVEYVLRHGGADHLRLAATHMNAYQTLHLDMWTVITIVSLAFYLLVFKTNFKARPAPVKQKTN